MENRRTLWVITLILFVATTSAQAEPDTKSLAISIGVGLQLAKLAAGAAPANVNRVAMRDAFQQVVGKEMAACKARLPGVDELNARFKLVSVGNALGVRDAGGNFAYVVTQSEWDTWEKRHRRKESDGKETGAMKDLEDQIKAGKIGKLETMAPKLILIYAKTAGDDVAPNALTDAQAACIRDLFSPLSLIRIGTEASRIAEQRESQRGGREPEGNARERAVSRGVAGDASTQAVSFDGASDTH